MHQQKILSNSSKPKETLWFMNTFEDNIVDFRFFYFVLIFKPIFPIWRAYYTENLVLCLSIEWYGLYPQNVLFVFLALSNVQSVRFWFRWQETRGANNRIVESTLASNDRKHYCFPRKTIETSKIARKCSENAHHA